MKAIVFNIEGINILQSIISLLLNNTKYKNIHLHLFFYEIPKETIATLANLCQFLKRQDHPNPIFHYDISDLKKGYFTHISMVTNRATKVLLFNQKVKEMVVRPCSQFQTNINIVVLCDIHGDTILDDFDSSIADILLNPSETPMIIYK